LSAKSAAAAAFAAQSSAKSSAAAFSILADEQQQQQQPQQHLFMRWQCTSFVSVAVCAVLRGACAGVSAALRLRSAIQRQTTVSRRQTAFPRKRKYYFTDICLACFFVLLGIFFVFARLSLLPVRFCPEFRYVTRQPTFI